MRVWSYKRFHNASLLLAGCLAAGLLTACTTAATTTTTSSINSSLSTIAENKVVYSLTTVGKSIGAIDLAERQSSDNFFYVVQQNGTIQRWWKDSRPAENVLDISALTDGGGERGLLGLAFRQIANKEWFAYINYTNRDGDTQIAEYAVNSDGSFNAVSRRIILEVKQPQANHNGGGLAVGPDNLLYIAMGDGGGSGDPERAAQNDQSFLGKILRIDPTNQDAQPEIWAKGLRNPWRFAIAANGDFWIADVGQNKWEEINYVDTATIAASPLPLNFGWSAFEGTHVFNKDQQVVAPVEPIYEYEHDSGACSISGAAIGTSTNMPVRQGWFFFGDYCTGTISALLRTTGAPPSVEEVATVDGNITAVRSTNDGIYVLTLDGEIHKINAQKA